MSTLIKHASEKTVSNTEITTYNLCGKQHGYMYTESIGPKKFSLPIYRGIVGHEALAAYYRELMAGSPFEMCKAAAFDAMTKETIKVITETPEDNDKLLLLVGLKELLDAYFEVHRVEPFKVVAVEETYYADIIQGELQYVLILDLLVEFTKGKYYGDLAVIDHKFVYNFKTMVELEVDAQMPKYIKALQLNGFFVTKGFFNQLRYREIKNAAVKDLFKRSELPATMLEVNNTWDEQTGVAIEIYENPKKPTRTLSPLVCKGCFYQPLCTSERKGIDTANMRQALYMPRVRPIKDIIGDVAE